MHDLYELKEKLMKELEEYGKQELTAGSLEVVDRLSHAIKNICKIIESYEMEEDYSMRDGNSRNPYDGNVSNRYSRTGTRYSRRRNRDSMGRYSRTDGVEELVETVRGMMQELPQNIQMDAQRFVQKLEQEM